MSMAQDSRHRPYNKVFICDRKTTVINLRNGAMTSTPTAVLASQIDVTKSIFFCAQPLSIVITLRRS
jgi:hypothetical protein